MQRGGDQVTGETGPVGAAWSQMTGELESEQRKGERQC